jgi:hypothetical protein
MEVTMRIPFALLLVLFCAPSVRAQAPDAARPAPAVEVTGGYTGFADEGIVGHAMLGTAARFHLTPRVSVGPELQYMIGEGEHRDLMLTGNLTFDFLSPRAGRRPRATPFVVVGGGMFRSSDRFQTGTYAHTEGGFTGGVGVRAWLSDRVYAATEFRVGWETHLRITGTLGVAMGR